MTGPFMQIYRMAIHETYKTTEEWKQSTQQLLLIDRLLGFELQALSLSTNERCHLYTRK